MTKDKKQTWQIVCLTGECEPETIRDRYELEVEIEHLITPTLTEERLVEEGFFTPVGLDRLKMPPAGGLGHAAMVIGTMITAQIMQALDKTEGNQVVLLNHTQFAVKKIGGKV